MTRLINSLRRRPLRLLLALFLVPVVVFSNAGMAGAATSGTLSFALDGGGSYESANCQVSWARTSTGISVGASSICQSGSDLSPFFSQPFEGTTGSYGFVLQDSAGNTCGSAGLPDRDVPQNGLSSVAAGLGAAFAPVSWDNCVPVQACLSYYWEGMPGGDPVDVVDCEPIPVDSPEPGWEPPSEMPWGTCQWGTPQAVAVAHKQIYQTLVKDKLKLLFYNRYPEPGDGLGLEWAFTIMHKPEGSLNAWKSLLATDDGSAGNQWVSDTLWVNEPSGFGGGHEEAYEGTPWGIQVQTRHGATYGANGGTAIGYTNPGKCSFWFGPKIRATDDPVYGDSDPWADVTDFSEPEPVPDDEPPVVTPVEDPGPDTEIGFWGAILSVLRSIWNAITGVVGGIIKGLKNLFIPEVDKWDVGELIDQLESKPPFSLLANLEDEARSLGLAYRAGGSCGTIANFGNGAEINCATIANVPGYPALYSLVSAGLMGLTGWSLFTMVARTFESGQ